MLKAARSASSMLEEIRSAEEWIDGYFTDWEERISRYVGPGWRPSGREGSPDSEDFDPENFTYEWMTIVGAQLTLGNPRARVTTTRRGPERIVAKAHQLALNRWIRETRMRQLNAKLVADFGMHRAICLTLPHGDPMGADLDDPKRWPTGKRISPRRYVYDTRAIEKEEELWRGHKSIHMRHELLERAADAPEEHWDVKAIEGLTEDLDVDKLRGRGQGREGSPRRDEVVLYNVWVRDYRPTKADRKRYGNEAWDRELRFGAWLTLGVVEGTTKSGWVRHPRPYWGHQRGPYVVIDGIPVPDEPVGLAQVPAVAGQVQELNVHARAASRAMRVYKKGILVDASDPEFEEKIKDFEDHWVVGIDGLDEIDRKVKEVELGGLTDQHLVHLQLLRDRVQRNGGITDVQRGQTDAGVTATADKLADNASATKVGGLAVIFVEGVREILENVSVYLAVDETHTPLGPEAAKELIDDNGKAVEMPVYHGGLSGEDELEWFFSLGLEIEPFSMGSTDDMFEQQRLLQFLNMIAVLLPMMAQYPFVLWSDLIESVAEMMNVPHFSDFFDFEQLRAFQALMLQGQDLAGQRGGSGPQPRLGRDVSKLLGGNQGVLPLTGNLVGAMLASQTRARGAMPKPKPETAGARA